MASVDAISDLSSRAVVLDLIEAGLLIDAGIEVSVLFFAASQSG